MPYLFAMRLTRKGKDFRRLDQDAQNYLANAEYSNAVDALQTIRGLEPIRTGRMRRETVIRKAGPLTYYIEGKAPYTRFQNDGTRFIPAKHFMERGIALVQPRAEQRTVDALHKAGIYGG